MIGFIYKLTDNSNRVYYGSTIKSLKKRLCEHKTPRNTCNSKIMDRDSMHIECLEQYYFDTDMDYKELLIKRESFYIRNNECINKKIPGRTMKEFQTEYYEKNKEQLLLKHKEYKEKNKAQILLNSKEYYENHKEQKKEYFEKNKESILLRTKVKFTCDCGGKYTYHNKSKHNKTTKHQKFINI